MALSNVQQVSISFLALISMCEKFYKVQDYRLEVSNSIKNKKAILKAEAYTQLRVDDAINKISDEQIILKAINIDSKDIDPKICLKHSSDKRDIAVALNMNNVTFFLSAKLPISLTSLEVTREQYIRSIRYIMSNHNSRISEINLLSDEEINLFQMVNQTKKDFPHDLCVHQMFELQATKNPNSIAITSEEDVITYFELERRSNIVANELRRRGIGPNVLVGVYMGLSIEYVIGVLSILKAGGGYVPLDISYPQERLALMCEEANLKLLLTNNSIDINNPLQEYETIDVGSFLKSRGPHDESRPKLVNNSLDLAYVIFTSGSTGRPKGVQVQHEGLVNLIDWHLGYYNIASNISTMLFASIAFGASVWELWPYLAAGSKIYITPDDHRKKVEQLCTWIISNKIDICWLPVSIVNRLLKEDLAHSLPIKYLLTGGEKLRNPILSPLPFEIINQYGQSETTVVMMKYKIPSRSLCNHPHYIGSPIQNTQVYILGEQGELQPIGVPGELHITGAGLARGYLNKPELTAEKFVPNPYAPGERMYRSGDLARWLPDGTIEYLGRIDHQVKIRGYRIELGEIESQLLRHPSVQETVVTALEDETGEKYLSAYIVSNDEWTTAQLRRHLLEMLPEYMVPSFFVALEQIPLTPNGKVDRRNLPAPAWQPVNERVMASTEEEERLVSIWEGVLGHTGLGVTDNFFELGGHSLKAGVLAARIERDLGVEVPLREIFNAPTIQELALYIAGAREKAYEAIPQVPEQAYYKVSSAQKRLFLLDRLEASNVAYNMPQVLEIEGPLDKVRLAESWSALVKRHESLRTTFGWENEEPVQRIQSDIVLKLEQYRVLESGTEVNSLIQGFIRPFHLEEGPLFRVGLIELAAEKHLLLLDMHHIISDGISMTILVREFNALYSGKELPELCVRYRDYGAWQEKQEEARKIQEKYWMQQFAGEEIPVLDLPTDYPRPVQRNFEGERISIEVDEELTQRLEQLAAETGTTLFMVLLAAYTVLLHKYTGQEDIIVGTPIAGRGHTDVENVVGMFVNTLALRNRPKAEQTFTALLEEVKETALEAYENQDYPFEELVEKVCENRDLSRNPLIDTMFVFQNMDQIEMKIENGRITPFTLEQKVSKFDLTLEVAVRNRGLQMYLEYCSALFTPETVNRMSGHLMNIMDAVTLYPNAEIGLLDILTAEERKQLLHTFNATEVEYPKEKAVHQLFEEQVEKTPNHVAVIYDGKEMTYRELNEKANQLARRLRTCGVQEDTIVGIMVERSFEMLIGIMGILKAGGAYLPVDPAYPEERIQYMLEDSGTKLLLSQGHLIHRLDYQGQFVDLNEVELYTGDASNVSVATDPSNLLYVIYTSGSTGKPKGVMIEHKSLINYISWRMGTFGYTATDRTLQQISVSFDGFGANFYSSLFTGSTMVLVEDEKTKLAEATLQLIKENRVTNISSVPHLYGRIMECAGPNDLDSLRFVVLAGDQADAKHLEQSKTMYGHVSLINEYGPTESTIAATAYLEMSSDRPHTIGRPIQNTQVYILGEQGELQPIGVPGELHISGAGLARGYLNKPELTAEKFVPNPYAPGERMYRSGDLARWLPDGTIEYLGRIDHQVKIRGYRIELGEIESQLLRHPSVQETVVTALEDETGEKYLSAYIVSNDEWTTAQLRRHLLEMLPEYMVPSFFVALEQIPLTPNGKVDRRNLPAPAWQPVNERVMASTEEEERLVSIWEGVLGHTGLGVTDNFFELGGHSLKAGVLAARIERDLGVEVPLREIFNAPTIQELALYIAGAREKAYEAIPQVPEQAYYKVSSAQKRLFLLDRLEASNVAYNMPQVLEIEGPLDKVRLAESWSALVKRHESLRTTFGWENEEPVQRIQSDIVLKLEQYRVLESGTEVNSLIQGFIRPFHLEEGPLFRVGLIELAAEKHLLLLDMHHIISDGISMTILVREFNALYSGKELPELCVRYRDYGAWQEKQEEARKIQEKYWMQQFAGEEIPVLDLPTDYPRPVQRNFEGERISIEVDEELTQRLEQLAAETGTTLFMVLLAAYTVLLHKYTGQEDIIVGTPIAGRGHTDVENVVGMFVNTLALRNRPKAEQTFTALLEEVKETALEAYENQDYPFEELVEKVCENRDLSRNPLIDTMFVFQNMDQIEMKIENGRITPFTLEQKVSKFDLTLEVAVRNRGLQMYLEYCSALFTPETVNRMSGHLMNIMDAVTLYPNAEIGLLDILTAEERKQLLHTFNATEVEYPKEKAVHQLFEEQVEKTPNHVAVIYDGKEMTYRELNEKANQLARRLRTCGVQEDTIVGIMVERSFEMLIGIMGILKAGGAYLPVDPAYPEERIQYMLEDSGTKLLLSQGHLIHRLDYQGQFVDLNEVELYTGDASNVSVATDPSNLLYVIYTSGSTGKPKGVMIEHKSLINYISWRMGTFGYTATDRTLQQISVSFDGFGANFYSSLFTGSTMVLVEDEKTKLAEATLQLIKENRVTNISSVPHLYGRIMECAGPNDLDSLRFVVLAGDQADAKHLEQSKTMYGHVSLINEYGPTESTIAATAYLEMSSDRPHTIGRPIQNTQVYILGEQGELQPIGVPGELHITGAGLARGYLNKPELTAEKFVPNPYAPGERMYRSGDLARWLPDGTIEYLGRIDHQVKIRGYRIELGEIESQLLRHPSVQETVVTALEDETGEKYLSAYIVGNDEWTTAQLRRHLLEMLPEYMVPSFFVALEQIPLTPNGKVDRRNLPAPAWQPVNERVMASTEEEERLVSIWEGVLGHTGLGVTDNFFELGGHSLKAGVLAARIERDLGVEVPLREIFNAPTIQELALYIAGAREKAYEAIPQVPEQAYYNVSSAQKRLFLLDRLEASNVAYNMPQVLEIEGPLDKVRLTESWSALVKRHESLRTTFGWENEEPVQRIQSDVVLKLEQYRVLESGTEVNSLIQGFIRPFHLEEGPLFRVGLIELAAEKHLLLLDMHHIISDGISMTILVREFNALYSGKELPELRVRYRDYGAWQENQEETRKNQEKYWIQQFAGEEIPVLDLPTDYPRPVQRNFEGERISIEVDEELTQRLEQLAVETGTTLFMVLLAAYTVLLHKYTGQEDIIVGTPIAGRGHTDVEHVVGMFVNTLALRNRPRAEQTFTALLKEVKENALKAYENQDYPFEKLVEQLDLRRDLGRNPLFDTMFVLQNIERTEMEMENGRISPYPFEHKVSKFDLTLEAVTNGNGLQIYLEYSSEIFALETVKAIIEGYLKILDEITYNQNIYIKSILTELISLETPEKIDINFNF
ncbi:amino acid adenylation domain-containing protein [Paenibacillus illinoisensis]|uniref:non-ribosomal peptide synthetase n=1 Tax=Paenibacillus illinoisensis TaxID=59845 RepID=UPI003D961082